MNKNHNTLKKEIYNVYSKLTDEELFESETYNNYLNVILEGLTKMYEAELRVTLIKENPNVIAYVMNNVKNRYLLCVNLLNDFIINHSDKISKNKIYKALTLHEGGHILFTDFLLSKETSNIFNMKHELYPLPDVASYSDFIDFVKISDNSQFLNVIYEFYHNFDNCIEDGHIERRIIEIAPGYAKDLEYLRDIHYLEMDSFEKMKQDGLSDCEIFMNLVLCYAKYSKIKASPDEKDPCFLRFLTILPLIDEAVFCCNSFKRKRIVNNVFCEIFYSIKEMLEQQQQQGQGQSQSQEQSQGQSQSQEQSQGQGQGQGQSQEQGQSQSQSQEQGQSQSQEQGQSQEQSQGQSQSQEQGQGPQQKQSLEQLIKEMENTFKSANKTAEKSGLSSEKEGLSTLSNVQNNPISEDRNLTSSSSSPKPTQSKEENNGNEESAEKLLEKIKKDEAEKRGREIVENQITKELENELKQTVFNDFHRGVTSSIIRPELKPQLYSTYDEIYKELTIVSNKLSKTLVKEIKDRQMGGKINGLYSGKRIDTHSCHRQDKKIFLKTKAPEDVPEMAVCLLVDESGSMNGEKITSARNTAFIMYLFCQKLGIPISIIGHTAESKRISLYNYAEYDSVDGKDIYRICGMQSRHCNRDGYSLKYCLEKLSKRPEETKLMMIISDGLPNDTGYKRNEGISDIQSLLKEYHKKDILFVAAGIGVDRNKIEDIYVNGLSNNIAATFMDVEDLTTLPKRMVGIIKKHLK